MPSKSKKQHNLMAAVAKNPAFAKKVGIKQSVGEEFLKADKGKRFGTGGDVNYTYGGQNQIGKQRTRFGSTFGYKNNIPNANLNKYIGKKEGGTVATDKLKKLFKGKESMKEELAEAKAIKSGKITPMQYAKGEKMEGHKAGGRIAAKGEHSVQKQSKRGAEMVKMRKGGKCYEDGGEVEFETKTGRNENIGDDVRARAMAALEKGISDDTAAEKSITKSSPSLPSRKAFVSKANKAGFTADQTGGGAALMYRKDRKMAKGGTASSRADGCATRGKTKGRMV